MLASSNLGFFLGILDLVLERFNFYLVIKPHYRSEGPRQGSCGVFLGDFWDYRCTFSFSTWLWILLLMIGRFNRNYIAQGSYSLHTLWTKIGLLKYQRSSKIQIRLYITITKPNATWILKVYSKELGQWLGTIIWEKYCMFTKKIVCL